MALDRFYNQEEVLSKQAAIGQIFDNQDQGTLAANQIRVPLRDTDIQGIPGISTPSVEKHYYAGSSLVSSEYNTPIEKIGDELNGYTIFVSPETDVRNAGFNQGTYSVVYNFLHNLSSVKISEISGDRTEVKLKGTVPGNPNQLGAISDLYLKNQSVAASSLTDPGSVYTPLMLNLGDNNLIPIVNARFDGQIVGEVDEYLQYPIGDTDGTIFFPVNDRALEAGLDADGETPYQTFAEVKIDSYIEATTNNTPHFELTGKFDEFKIVQNADTSLSWIRKNSLGDTVRSGSLP